jgi:DNA-binding IclR family transcriptional regulator
VQTERDSQIVSWIGGLDAAGAEHVMSEFGMSRSIAYQRLNSLTRDGLLEHHEVLYGRPGMYTATLSGLRWKGIGHLGVFNV